MCKKTGLLVGLLVLSGVSCLAGFPLKQELPAMQVSPGKDFSGSIANHLMGGEMSRSFLLRAGDAFDSHHQRCLTSKVGTGAMIAGGGIILVGTGLGFTQSNENNIAISRRGVVWLVSWVYGSAVLVAGGIVAIIGAIYDASNHSRLTVISPGCNEGGLAYHFR